MTEPSRAQTRNVPMGAMAIFALAVCGLVAFYALYLGGWWRLMLIPLPIIALALVYGVFESFQKAHRDSDGNRIRS